MNAVQMHDDVRIPVGGGVTLAARIWRPEEAGRFPAILEYLPYRRRDGTAERDQLTHPYFAAHGYACVRVDIRGSGDSGGVLKGEYLGQEQDDALAILEWLEAQEWCTGAVGMIGISWGGFNGLQVAARRPKQLKAVISLCSTDDRYADDIHFMGGAFLLDKVTWGSTMFSLNAAPPDPAVVGERWREMWRERLEGSGFWLEDWLKHQRRDEFYKHGSICENWSAIQCPVYAVGGWADGYTNAVFRLLQHLKCPRKGLVGPWAHKYPHFAKPGPQIGFLQECLRWWDYWLKSEPTGVMDEPMLRAWIEEPIRPAPYNPEKPGRWVAQTQWPPANVEPKRFALAPHRLGAASDAVVEISSPQTVGLAAGKWCAYGSWEDQPLDQRQELGGQLIFDTEPLVETFDVLGAPLLTVMLSCDEPQALLCATLCEVFPDGAATRVSYGILNLTHRSSHETPESLKPGERIAITLQLNECGHRFGVGNRIRLALSNAYWPVVWPSPRPNTLSIHCAGSALTLPERVANPLDATLAELAAPASATPLAHTMIETAHNSWTVTHDVMAGTTTLARINEGGLARVHGTGMEWGVKNAHIYTIEPDDPASARLDTHYLRRYRRGDWAVTIETKVAMSSTPTHFLVDASLEAREGDAVVHEKACSLQIPRELV